MPIKNLDDNILTYVYDTKLVAAAGVTAPSSLSFFDTPSSDRFFTNIKTGHQIPWKYAEVLGYGMKFLRPTNVPIPTTEINNLVYATTGQWTIEDKVFHDLPTDFTPGGSGVWASAVGEVGSNGFPTNGNMFLFERPIPVNGTGGPGDASPDSISAKLGISFNISALAHDAYARFFFLCRVARKVL